MKKNEKTNGYIAFFKDKKEEIYADTMWEATQEARRRFKPSKKDKYLISVILAESNGEQVTHNPAIL